MATRPVTSVDMGSYVLHTWPDLDAADDGKPVFVGGAKSLVWQIIGGTSSDLEGSNDGGTTWAALYDSAGVITSDEVPGFVVVRDAPALVRPAGVAGSNMKIVLAVTR